MVLQPAIVGTVRSGAAAEARMEAGLVARTLIASPTLFQAGTTASGRMNGHDWTVRFAPLEIAAGSPGKVASVVFRPMRMIVDVAVDARRRGRLQVETVAPRAYARGNQRMRRPPSGHRSDGFLLVETLVAMAIGAFILVALGSTIALVIRGE